jgi:hypothetical protein
MKRFGTIRPSKLSVIQSSIARRTVHERGDELVEELELIVEELRAASQLAQRDAGGVADDVAGPGAQRRQPADQGSRRAGRTGRECPRARSGPGPWPGSPRWNRVRRRHEHQRGCPGRR